MPSFSKAWRQASGEVLVKVRGGTEAYLAWSEQPLAKGTTVLVFKSRGARTVDVMQWIDLLDELGGEVIADS